MTVLEIINRVLRRLREDAVASVTETPYSTMLGDLLHDVHQEVVSSFEWPAFLHTVTLSLTAGVRVAHTSATTANGGDVTIGERPTTESSLLQYDGAGRPMVFLFDDLSDTDGDQLQQVSYHDIEAMYQREPDQEQKDPYLFALRRNSADPTGYDIYFYPTLTENRVVRAMFWTPETEVVPTTDSTRDLATPSRPLVLGTLMMALNERGEEMGEPGNVAERRYYSAIADAIEAQRRVDERTDRLEYRRD